MPLFQTCMRVLRAEREWPPTIAVLQESDQLLASEDPEDAKGNIASRVRCNTPRS